MTIAQRLRHGLPWLVVLVLLVPWSGPRERDVAHGSPLARLLGPIGSLAASVQWVRFDLALRAGRTERAYARAESALRLDPVSPEGWLTLGRHLITVRGSSATEQYDDRRMRWMRAGLDLLRRGEDVTNAPGELALAQGVYLAFFVDEVLAAVDGVDRSNRSRYLNFLWPGGRLGALREAIEAFERAEAHGHPRAHAALHETTERAAVWVWDRFLDALVPRPR
ncbi:MAG: hypothetical protein GY711_22375 [bacterium]|nr:hypothetical protein [bacterium]